MPRPNSHWWAARRGAVTGSVAMKNAASMVAPLNQWNNGEPRLAELPPS